MLWQNMAEGAHSVAGGLPLRAATANTSVVNLQKIVKKNDKDFQMIGHSRAQRHPHDDG